ncbi:hypothetical protein BTN50_1015 [Candidatus Enterovibrio altilux]|uniref:Uncharacterized protein n=1 Tax=Candidatus Enterovibrio altilux TaxID=1927128 RepID=A0A291B936_9GAMM|nr:hypothetical protein BTN50_1015 [Candidatus Enterovibrio luxaltus]
MATNKNLTVRQLKALYEKMQILDKECVSQLSFAQFLTVQDRLVEKLGTTEIIS